MELLNNFSSVYCFIAFIIVAMFMFTTLCIAVICKYKEPKNKVHFYVARDKNGELWLYIGKPNRYRSTFANPLSSLFTLPCNTFDCFGLNEKDYANIKWEDDPIEVFINMKD